MGLKVKTWNSTNSRFWKWTHSVTQFIPRNPKMSSINLVNNPFLRQVKRWQLYESMLRFKQWNKMKWKRGKREIKYLVAWLRHVEVKHKAAMAQRIFQFFKIKKIRQILLFFLCFLDFATSLHSKSRSNKFFNFIIERLRFKKGHWLFFFFFFLSKFLH